MAHSSVARGEVRAPRMNKFATDFAYRFGYKGPVMESKLPIDKIKEFLEENSKTLEDLTKRHIEKLEQFSK